MPAMNYDVKWPDGDVTTCYSPSLVIKDFFEVGQSYPVSDFLDRARSATRIASERVAAKFGFVCSKASDQLYEIETKAALFSEAPNAQVQVISFNE